MRYSYKLFTLLVIAVVMIVWLIWYNYSAGQEPPLLKADLSPTRIKPDASDDNIEKKYNNIYDHIRNSTESTYSVHLVPEPEEPIKISINDSSQEQQNDPISNIISGIIAESHSPNVSPIQDVTNPDTKLETLTVITLTDDSTKQNHRKKLKSEYYLHLSSTSTKDSANKEWTRISKIHSRILSEVGYKILKSDTKNTGIFYQLLAGPIKDHSRAKLLCKKLVTAKQNCIIKKI